MERRIIRGKGYRFIGVDARPFSKTGIRNKFISLFVNLHCFFQSMRILKRENPAFVCGTGGYVEVPVIFAASILRIPTLITEQNFVPGLATRVLSKIASQVHLTFEESKRYLPARAHIYVSGNPMRQGIGKITKGKGCRYFSLDPKKKTVLFLGGSAGAHRINQVFCELVGSIKDLQFIIITGSRDYQDVRKRCESPRVAVLPFIEEIEYAYGASDAVVSRAGATTIAEIITAAKPSILIPYPYAGYHQKLNAEWVVEKKGGIMIEDENLSKEVLRKEILEIIKSKNSKSMEENLKGLSVGDAARKIAKEIEKICSDT